MTSDLKNIRPSTLPLPIVNPQAYTPLDYWQTGASIPPDSSRGRIARYELLQTLFDGDHTLVTTDDAYHFNALQANFFRLIPKSFADLMMGFPPTDPARDDELMYQLSGALYQALIDYAVYGVGLLYPWQEEGEPRVTAVSPRYWYPMPDGEGDVWIAPASKHVDVYVLAVDGPHEMRRFDREERMLEGEAAHFLGTLRETTPIAKVQVSSRENLTSSREDTGEPPPDQQTDTGNGDTAAKREIDGGVPPPKRSILAVQSPPKLGEFGYSWLPEIAPFNIAITQVQTDIRNVSHRHSYPMLVEAGLEDAMFTTDDDQLFQALQLAAQARRGGVYQTSAANVEYLVWESNLEALFKQRDDLVEAILTMTGLPLSIFGIFNENSPSGAVSGEALRRTYVIAYNMIRRVQREWLHAVTGLLDLFGPGGEVEWPHPLGEEEQGMSDPMEANEDVFDDPDGDNDGDDQAYQAGRGDNRPTGTRAVRGTKPPPARR